MPSSSVEYTKLLSELVQTHMVVFGPNIALDKARKVSGMKVDTTGEVVSLTGDSKLVLKALMNEYINLSGQVAETVLHALLQKYPSIKYV